jgi:hypothetical protein
MPELRKSYLSIKLALYNCVYTNRRCERNGTPVLSPEQRCVNIHTSVASFLLWGQISLLQVHVREMVVSTARPLKLNAAVPI